MANNTQEGGLSPDARRWNLAAEYDSESAGSTESPRVIFTESRRFVVMFQLLLHVGSRESVSRTAQYSFPPLAPPPLASLVQQYTRLRCLLLVQDQ
jgi:hypothetical protein